MKLPRTKQSANELYALTVKKKEYIKSLGMNLVSIWEHEFDALLKEDANSRKIVEGFDIQERLDPRHFFGGRTNAIKLQHKVSEGETIKYVDFTSLYPYVNKYKRYPCYHPIVMTTGLDDVNTEDIFGIIKCRILPPRGQFLPLLPYKCNGKLMFPLCRTCAETQNQEKCRHSEEERALTGTWCSPEIIKATELGYKILKMYEVYHWEHTTQYDPNTGAGGLFASYVNLFLKIKQESSNWPEWVQTEKDMEEYLREYFEREGIQLDRNNISQNEAMRSLAKLLLNSFWGKFGQRPNFVQTIFFHEQEADKFFRWISDANKEIKDFAIVAKDTIMINWQNKSDLIEESFSTNIFIATFTTCWARLKLYKVLEMLQERVLYHDTDSCMYISRPNDVDFEPKFEVTSELSKGDHIVHFVSGGPKQYAYETFSSKQVCHS